MNEATPCPDRQTLADSLAGKLNEPQDGLVRGHIAACVACRSVIEELGNETTIVERHAANTFSKGGPRGAGETSDAATRLDGEPFMEEKLREAFEFIKPLMEPSDNDKSFGRILNYDLLEIVGGGGMGIVLKALDNSLHRIVALKVVAPRFASSEKAKLRLLREARAAAVINHPNVVTIHAVAAVKGLPILVMEFVEGHSLDQRIHSDKTMSMDEILQISAQIAAGLAAAHQHGVIHRDIKPANIMLEDHVQRVKITDFGLAKVVMEMMDLTSFGEICGTPAYMSPEQVAGDPVDQRSDLFSLGTVMYAMTTGRSPFRGGNTIAVIRRVSDHVPESVHKINPEMPEFLSNIVMRLLEKDPKDRFGTSAEVAYLLAECVARSNQSPSETMELPSMTRASRPRRARKTIATSVFVGFLALATVALLFHRTIWHAVSTSFIQPSRPEHPANEEDANDEFETIWIEEFSRNHAPPETLVELVGLENEMPGFQTEGLPIWAVAISPDGAVAASAATPSEQFPASNPVVYLWDVESGEEIARLEGHLSRILSVAFSRDGNRILSGDEEGITIGWDVASRREVGRIAGTSGRIVAFTPRENHVLVGGQATLSMVDLVSGEIIVRFDIGNRVVWDVDVSKNGRLVLSCGSDTETEFCLWHAETGRLIREYSGHTGPIESVAFVSGFNQAVSAGHDTTIRLWDLVSGSEIRTLIGHTDAVFKVDVFPNGRHVISASRDKTIRLWDLDSGEEVKRFNAHTADVRDAAFSGDGRCVVSGSLDATSRCWKLSWK